MLPLRLRTYTWKLVLVCLEHNISFKAKHILGVNNKLADCLSRFQVAGTSEHESILFRRTYMYTPPFAAS